MVWGGIMPGALQPAFECVGKTELGHDLANGIDDYGKMVSASPGLRRRTEPLDLLVDWSELAFRTKYACLFSSLCDVIYLIETKVSVLSLVCSGEFMPNLFARLEMKLTEHRIGKLELNFLDLSPCSVSRIRWDQQVESKADFQSARR
jgi:hypothetical protein